MVKTRISRGFRRLSVLMGFLGFLCALPVIAPDEHHHWDGAPIVVQPDQSTAAAPERAKDSPQVLTDKDFESNFVPVGSLENVEDLRLDTSLTVLAFIAVPTVVTLLVGWVVAGFRYKETQ